MPILKNKKTETKVQEIPEESYSEKAQEDVKFVVQEESRETSKEKLKKFIEEETKLVKGKFVNFECPGGSQKIIVKKYKEVPAFEQFMEDGKTYEIPLYVARHLNGVDATAKKVSGQIHTCSYPVNAFKYVDGQAPASREDAGRIVPLIVPSKWTRRFGFESLEFDAKME